MFCAKSRLTNITNKTPSFIFKEESCSKKSNSKNKELTAFEKNFLDMGGGTIIDDEIDHSLMSINNKSNSDKLSSKNLNLNKLMMVKS